METIESNMASGLIWFARLLPFLVILARELSGWDRSLLQEEQDLGVDDGEGGERQEVLDHQDDDGERWSGTLARELLGAHLEKNKHWLCWGV